MQRVIEEFGLQKKTLSIPPEEADLEDRDAADQKRTRTEPCDPAEPGNVACDSFWPTRFPGQPSGPLASDP